VTRDPTRPPAFQPGTYGVVYADPPWRIETWSARGKGRAAEAYYDTMDLGAIKALPVSIWASRDAVLLLWAHNSMLPQALEVMTAWGFTYKARGFTWAKRPVKPRSLPGSRSAPVRVIRQWPITSILTTICAPSI
jgi:N6-adenosine-specific RNA methylase IME4